MIIPLVVPLRVTALNVLVSWFIANHPLTVGVSFPIFLAHILNYLLVLLQNSKQSFQITKARTVQDIAFIFERFFLWIVPLLYFFALHKHGLIPLSPESFIGIEAKLKVTILLYFFLHGLLLKLRYGGDLRGEGVNEHLKFGKVNVIGGEK